MRVISAMLLGLLLCACGEENGGNGTSSYQCNRIDPNPYLVEYPDGQTRKSERWDCDDGCAFFYFVNDLTVNFRTCDPPASLVK